MRRAVSLALILVSLLASTGLAAAAPVQRASMAEIESQVMCVTCGIPLELAVSPQADRERARIQAMINQGLTTAQIKQALVVQLGPNVLALPPKKGFDLAVYIVPVVVIAVLLVILTVGLRRWRRRDRSEDEIAPQAPELGLGDATRLREDLARFDA
ncbi:MAG TPA: cytochrome c-type biogenesis protein CcmH [Solirubrobacteraceae bacterium]|nr:cytochrome c-type biogenesis protein CcmH [Solirubrobacteraceae bacterium]